MNRIGHKNISQMSINHKNINHKSPNHKNISRKSINPKNKSFMKTNIEERPFIRSYVINMDKGTINDCPIEWCEKLIGKISEYFDVEGIILGHIKGILLMTTCKVSYSVTHTGKVSVDKHVCDSESTKATDSNDSIFKCDVLSYIYPTVGYDDFIQYHLN